MERRVPALGYGLLAYAGWGVCPLYWRLLDGLGPVEIVAQRVVWSLVLLSGVIVVTGRAGEVRAVCRNAGQMRVLGMTAALLGLNWGLFIYGVMAGRLVETSLGQFLIPLASVALGMVCLRERPGALRLGAVAVAGCGVVLYGWQLGRVPWLALCLGVSFAVYGLLRKRVPVSPLAGLAVEMGLMLPVALGVLVMTGAGGRGLGSSTGLTLLLLGSGVVTALPLYWFNCGAKLLPLSTMGILQYVEPTLELLIGVWIFREVFAFRAGVAFSFIWLGIALYALTYVYRRSAGKISKAGRHVYATGN